MRWFRLYDGLIRDFKVQTLEPVAFKDWINLLCMASGNDPRGNLPPLNQIAYHFQATTADAEARVACLVEAGLIDRMPDGSMRPHDWDNLQPKSDRSASDSGWGGARKGAGRPSQKIF